MFLKENPGENSHRDLTKINPLYVGQLLLNL